MDLIFGIATLSLRPLVGKKKETLDLTTVSWRLRRRGDKAGRWMRRNRISCNTKQCVMQLHWICRLQIACLCVRFKPTWYVVPYHQKGRVPAHSVRVSTRYRRMEIMCDLLADRERYLPRRVRVEHVVEIRTRLDRLLCCAFEKLRGFFFGISGGRID